MVEWHFWEIAGLSREEFMSDKDVVEKLLQMTPQSEFIFEEEKCVSANFTSSADPYFGLIRHMSPSDKKTVLRLVSKLNELKRLDFHKNRMGNFELPLQKLEHLDIGSNYTGSVPEWIRGNPLEYLNLGVNELSSIPDWIAEFTDMKVLKLHKNRLRDVSAISSHKRMKFLNLYLNQIRNIPDEIWNLTEIEFFSWGVSGIKEVSERIGNWQNLRWLSLVANKLERLPDNLCTLTQLIGMRVHKNRLTELPENIGNLKNLSQLTVYRNRLRRLPESFRMLKLKKLNLAHNEFDKPLDVKADWLCLNPEDCQWDRDG